MNDRIERETLINATVDRVWSVITQPGFWVYEKAELGDEAIPGASTVVTNPDWGDFEVLVEKVDPKSYLSYRWASAFPGQKVRDDNSTLIEFRLDTVGDQTRLSVVESGFAALPAADDARLHAFEANTDGWGVVFDIITQRAED